MSGEAEQLDLELMSDEEAKAYKEVPPIGDEPETTSEEEKVEKVEEPSPSPKIEEPPKEPAAKEVVEPTKEEKPPTIDGIIAKDGKNFIPFSVLEEERAAKKAAIEDKQRLEAEIVELRKPKPEPVREPVKEELKKPEPPPVDFKVLGKKLYESEDGAAEVLQQIFEAGKKAGEQSAVTVAETTAKAATVEHDFKREVERIKTANPWIQGDPDVEETISRRALRLMDERKLGEHDIVGMVRAAEDAVTWAKGKFRVDEPKVDIQAEITKAVETAVKAERDKVTKEILAKFNIKESDAVTLSDVRNLSPDVTSKFDELDKLYGIDYEEALGQLTPEERDAYLSRAP